MRIAILGKGGRESALAWKLEQSESVQKILVYPGNPGMESEKVESRFVLQLSDIEQEIKGEKIDFVVVGQETYLEQGYIDKLIALGIPCVGPVRAAAKLESSKLFRKQILQDADVPTADFKAFSNHKDLKLFVDEEITRRPLVLKWDYLADGKGVFVCSTPAQIDAALLGLQELATKQGRFSVIVEDYLQGKEFSAFCLVDGDKVEYFSSACDYKRLSSDPKSPNTGGMGTYSPADVILDPIKEKQMILSYAKRIIQRLKKSGMDYNGFLFLGMMQTASSSMVLEINTRLGDPETQTLLPRLQSDLAEVLFKMSKRSGLLTENDLVWSTDFAIHVVKADENYPKAQTSKQKISISPLQESVLFFSGVEKQDGQLVSSGGRILGLSAMAQTKDLARKKVYADLPRVSFTNEYYREDIGC